MTPYWKCIPCRWLAPRVSVRPVCRRCGMPCTRVVPPYTPPEPSVPPVSRGTADEIARQCAEAATYTT